MKQRIFILNALLCLVLSVWAVPAKRGVWCSLSLVDGTEVKAQLVGDEFLRFAKSLAYCHALSSLFSQK